MKQTLIYSLKVWITGVIIALILTWVADIVAPYAFSEYLYSGFFGRIAEVFLFSLAYAIPFGVLVRVLLTFSWKITSIKVILTFLTLILGWLPVIALTAIIDEPVSAGYTLGALVYVFLNCICIYLYRLKPGISNSEIRNYKFKNARRSEKWLVLRPLPFKS
ncbi:MAG: hypothetical protein JWQ66_732 [Mucilaginibacter sp.]|nr:hypothetical protein [Mucilaginibacter sp.]